MKDEDDKKNGNITIKRIFKMYIIFSFHLKK